MRNNNYNLFRKIIHFGLNNYCPLCESYLRAFKPWGIKRRSNARCPVCGSLERHRLDWLAIKTNINLISSFAPQKMLHVAPEKTLAIKFNSIRGLEYISADLSNPAAMIKMDITDIHFEANHFDFIYCSHVLEHIVEDRLAISELYRVLKIGGRAIINVPIETEKTFEDPSVNSPEERTRIYGHPSHVRNYGMDFIERLENVNFRVDILTVQEIIEPKNIFRMGIIESDKVFLCRKMA